MKVICPEVLAATIRDAREQKEPLKILTDNPRFIEMLWFIQAQSMRPEGMSNFASRIIETFPEMVTSHDLVILGKPQRPDGRYSVESLFLLWKSTSVPVLGVSTGFCDGFDRWAEDNNLDRFHNTSEMGKDLKAQVSNFLAPLDYGHFYGKAVASAKVGLPDILVDWCRSSRNWEHAHGVHGRCHIDALRQSVDLPVCDLYGWICRYMDLHTETVRGQIADTKVTKAVFHELDFSVAENVPVKLVGDSRFGKTKTIESWCQMYPGRARLITIPDGNRDRDLYAAHADAFGLYYSSRTVTTQIKASVEFICRYSGLFCVYDEAQFLIPQNYSKNTPPKRLNWVRCQVIDRGTGCVFVDTPQNHKQSIDQYTKLTGYRMEQWIGRVPTIALPHEMDESDLLSIAQQKFPNFHKDLILLMVFRAGQTIVPLQTINIAGKRARYLAGLDGRKDVLLEDVKAALVYATPDSVPSMGTRSDRPDTARMQPRGKGLATRFNSEGGEAVKPAQRAVRPQHEPVSNRLQSVVEEPELLPV